MTRTKKETHCANHPDVIATEKCHHCEKDICYNCQVRFGKNIFCSGHCVFRHLFGAFFKHLGHFLKDLFVILVWPFRMLGRISFRGWLELSMVSAVIILFYFQWHLVGEVRQLHSNRGASSPAISDTVQVLARPVFRPTEGGMVTSNIITVDGEAENNRVITLSVDGELKQVQLAEKGHFVFKDVKLHRGENCLVVRAITEDGQVSMLQTLNFSYATPPSSYLIRDFQRGNPDKKQMAFTFDGGASDNITDEILDILKERNIHCTFFLTGHFIKGHPESVKRIVEEGHEVGNHTWSHPKMTSFEENGRHETLNNMSAEFVQQELNKTASLFQMVSGKTMAPLWRSPYGYHNKEIRTWAAEAGYKHVGWTVGRGWKETMDSLDWVADKKSKAYHSSEEIAEKILTFGEGKPTDKNGAIILMHLGTNRTDDFPHQKLPEILDTLMAQGFEMVTISKLLQEIE